MDGGGERIRDPLDGFSVIREIPVAWAEMDAFGVVNHAVIFRYFEDARIPYLEAIGFRTLEERSVGPILSETRGRFRRPIRYPAWLRSGARVRELELDRFRMEYRVVDATSGELLAEGEATVVAYDYASGRKAEVPPEVVTRIREVEGALLAG
jgi:acyl-CoA thioester hydrolase